MALLTAEIQRIKAELGYNVLTVDAEPYIGVSRLFEVAIQPYVQAGTSTTSSTSVTAASTPTPVTLTLGSTTGVAAFAVLVVDVDSRQERATVQSVTGLTATLLLTLAHSGTYPVTVEGGETMIREWLSKLRAITDPGGPLSKVPTRAGIQKVDEITFAINPRTGRTSSLADVLAVQEYCRDELASVLNVQRLNRRAGGGGASLAAY